MAVRMSDLMLSTLGELRFQPTPKRVRGLLEGQVVLDSGRAAVVWEPQRLVPSYAVPHDDLAADLQPTRTRAEDVPARPVQVGNQWFYDPRTPFRFHTCPGTEFTVRTANHQREAAAFAPEDERLADYLIMDFAAFDWLEEDEPILAHPRDPFSRIDVRSSGRRVRFEHRGQVIAESDKSLMLYEGVLLPPRYYLPMSDVRAELQPSARQTACAYKGLASYWSVVVGEKLLEDVVWSYPEPFPELQRIRGLVSLFNERLEVFLDGIRQPSVLSPWS